MNIWKQPIVLFGGLATLMSLVWYAFNTGYPRDADGVLSAAAKHAFCEQSACVLAGGLLCWLVSRINYRKQIAWAILLMITSWQLMLSVVLANLWSDTYEFGMCLPLFLDSLQPARWAPLVTVVFIAAFEGRQHEFQTPEGQDSREKESGLTRNDMTLAVIMFLNLLLVAAAGGYRPPLILFITVLVMTVAAGKRKAAGLFAALCIIAFLLYVCSDHYRLARALSNIHEAFNREEPSLRSLSVIRLMLWNGGWFGAGFGNSQYWYVVKPHEMSCFLTPIAGEELGGIALIALLLCVVLILISGAVIAFRARDRFGRLLAIGIVTMLGVQSCLHVAFVLDVFPLRLTAVPMPFISELGINACLPLICVGLLLSVVRQRDVMPC